MDPQTVTHIAPESGPLRGRMALWVLAGVTALIFLGGTLPTPLYLLYQRRFGFSELTLTLIFAVWVLGTGGALLLLGRVADQIGRRHAALPALALALLSTVLFLAAGNEALLFVARFASGLAVGLFAGAATAWLTELEPAHDARGAAALTAAATNLGLGLGPLLSGVLASGGARPLELPYIVYLLLLLPGAGALTLIRGTRAPQVGQLEDVSLAPDVSLPARVRRDFFAAGAAGFGAFAVTGFYTALAPQLLAETLHRGSPALSGAVVCLCFGSASALALLTARLDGARAMRLGLLLILPTVLLLAAAASLGSLRLLLVDAICAGAASALATRGSLEVLQAHSPGERRAAVSSAYYLVCYAGVALPAIGMGLLGERIGPPAALRVFAGVIGLLALAGRVAARERPAKRPHRTSLSR